jgi:hypothetical protein
MFGVRPSSLFKSRWMALAWCVLICLTAIGFVGAPQQDDSGAAQTQDDAQAMNAAIASLN